MLKVSNGDTRTMPRSDVFIVNFKQIPLFLVFLLLALSMFLFAGLE